MEKYTGLLLLLLSGGVFLQGGGLWAHCEIPCGIYDDEARFNLIAEDIQTIEKGMNQITELQKDPAANMNQIVRWVQNKDDHANRIKEAVADYFLSQRVKKPAAASGQEYDQYTRQLTLLHDLTVAAMKAKQTTDLQHVNALKKALEDFKTLYWAIHGHQH